MATTQTEEAKFRRYRWVILFCQCYFQICQGLLLGIVGPSMTEMAQQLGVSYASISLAIGGKGIGMLIGSPLGGALKDHFMHRVDLILCSALLVEGVATIAMPFCPNLATLAVANILHGLCFGGANVVNVSYLATLWGSATGGYMNIVMAATAIGKLLGPPIVEPFLFVKTDDTSVIPPNGTEEGSLMQAVGNLVPLISDTYGMSFRNKIYMRSLEENNGFVFNSDVLGTPLDVKNLSTTKIHRNGLTSPKVPLSTELGFQFNNFSLSAFTEANVLAKIKTNKADSLAISEATTFGMKVTGKTANVAATTSALTVTLNSTVSTPAAELVQQSVLYLAFVICFLILLLNSAAFVFAYALKPRRKILLYHVQEGVEHATFVKQDTGQTRWLKGVMCLVLFIMCVMFDIAIEASGIYLFPIAIAEPLRFTIAEATVLNSMFYISLTLSRLTGSLLLRFRCVTVPVLLNSCICAAIIAGALMAFLGMTSRTAFWATTLTFIFFIAPSYPTAFAFANHFVPLTGLMAAVMDAGLATGYLLSSDVSALLFDNFGPQAVLLLFFGVTCVCPVASTASYCIGMAYRGRMSRDPERQPLIADRQRSVSVSAAKSLAFNNNYLTMTDESDLGKTV